MFFFYIFICFPNYVPVISVLKNGQYRSGNFIHQSSICDCQVSIILNIHRFAIYSLKKIAKFNRRLLEKIVCNITNDKAKDLLLKCVHNCTYIFVMKIQMYIILVLNVFSEAARKTLCLCISLLLSPLSVLCCFFARCVLQKLCVALISRKLNIANDRATNKTVFHRKLKKNNNSNISYMTYFFPILGVFFPFIFYGTFKIDYNILIKAISLICGCKNADLYLWFSLLLTHTN